MIPRTADILDEYLKALDSGREADGKFHPSSLWMCDRQAVMTARGEKKSNPPDAKSLRVFKVGHLIHELIQAAMSWKFDTVDSSSQVVPTMTRPEFAIEEEWVVGHGDDALFINFLLPDEEVIVYEFKSTRSLAKQRKSGKPSEHHVAQGATYAAALAAKGTNVKELRVVYFEKTNLDIQEFIIPYNPEWRVQLDKKVAELQPYLDQPGVYPPCTGESWLKPYCPFFPICHQQNPNKPAEVFSWDE